MSEATINGVRYLIKKSLEVIIDGKPVHVEKAAAYDISTRPPNRTIMLGPGSVVKGSINFGDVVPKNART